MNLTAGEHGAVKWSGMLVVPEIGEFHRAVRDGWLEDGLDGWEARVVAPGRVVLAPLPNLVTNSGINIRLDRLFAINGPPAAVSKMGVDNGSTNPTASTDSSGSNTKTIIAFDSTATRSGQVVSAVGTFNQANVNFSMRRLFLSNTGTTLTNSTTADPAGSLHSMTNVFTIDLTAFSTWSQTFTAQVTGTGS
jgi:hypothetical protein